MILIGTLPPNPYLPRPEREWRCAFTLTPGRFLENGESSLREITLLFSGLRFDLALRFWHVPTLPRIESAEKLKFKLTHYRE